MLLPEPKTKWKQDDYNDDYNNDDCDYYNDDYNNDYNNDFNDDYNELWHCNLLKIILHEILKKVHTYDFRDIM